MTQKEQLALTQTATHSYHCTDVAQFHSWLEAQGYTFYGPHSEGEYGRFSLQEAHDADARPQYVHRFIQVFANGEVYSPDVDACELLNTLTTSEE